MREHERHPAVLARGRTSHLPTVGDGVVETEIIDEVGHLADELGIGDRFDGDGAGAVRLHRHVDRDVEVTRGQHDRAERGTGESEAVRCVSDHGR